MDVNMEKILQKLLTPFPLFLGIFALLTGFMGAIEQGINRGALAIVLLICSYLFYYIFEYLGKVPGGRLIGLMPAVVLFSVVTYRFYQVLEYGTLLVTNSALKRFMTSYGVNVELFTYSEESADIGGSFGSTFFVGYVGVLVLFIICFSYYKRKSPVMFLIGTLPFFILTLVVGVVMSYLCTMVYFFATVWILVAREPKEMKREFKDSLKMVATTLGSMLVVTLVCIIIFSAARYAKIEKGLWEIRLKFESLSYYDIKDWETWFTANFGADAIDYGHIGDKGEIRYNDNIILELKDDNGFYGDLYLKGFVGDKFENNTWTRFSEKDGAFLLNKKQLSNRSGVNIEDPVEYFSNYLVEKRGQPMTARAQELSTQTNTSVMQIRNIALGAGNRVVPYGCSSGYSILESGKIDTNTASLYTTTYYPDLGKSLYYPNTMEKENSIDIFRSEFLPNLASFAGLDPGTKDRSTYEFFKNWNELIRQHYMEVPDRYNEVIQDFYQTEIPLLQDANATAGSIVGCEGIVANNTTSTSVYDVNKHPNASLQNYDSVISRVQHYLMSHAKYSLRPGNTPDGEDSINYFLKTNKKGYCVYFASAGTFLFRACGIPARYVEGVRVSDCAGKKTLNVRDSDAHAWVEIFRENVGWEIVDVTPGGPTENPDSITPKEQEEEELEIPESETTENAEEAETEMPVVTEEPQEENVEEEQQEETVDNNDNNDDFTDESNDDGGDDGDYEDESDEDEDDGSGSDSNSENTNKRNPFVAVLIDLALIFAAAIAVLVVQFHLRKMYFERKVEGTKYKGRVIYYFLHLTPILRAYDCMFEKQSAAEYATLLQEKMGVEEGLAKEFIDTLLRAQFGGKDFSREEFRDFKKNYDKIRRKGLSDMNFVKRLFAILLSVC